MTLLPQPGEHPGFTLWRLSLALVGLLVAMAAFGVRGTAVWATVTVVAAWCVTWSRPWTAVAAGAEVWALETSFGDHRHGELTFARSDLVHLAVLLGVTVLVAAVTRRAGARSSRSRERPGGGR